MSKVVKAAVGLMIVTIFAKVVGFAREQVLSFAYGTSMYTDIYVMAMNIPNVIFAAIGAALSTTFIPIFCEINQNEKKHKVKGSVSFMPPVAGLLIAGEVIKDIAIR